MVLKAGDKFPEGVKFGWAPILDEDPTVCGIPQLYDANKEWAGKKVVIVAVPGKSTQPIFNLTGCESLSYMQLWKCTVVSSRRWTQDSGDLGFIIWSTTVYLYG